MKLLRAFIAALFIINLPNANAATVKPIAFTAEVWADNWFALYVNGKKVGEDSVPISTQKSFNSETIKFSATYPLTIGFVAKDYVQSSSGLEYLGQPNQQIGDGGLIFQIRESASDKLVTVSDASWKSFVQNIAPTNVECEKSASPETECKYTNFTLPSNWYGSTFKDSNWKNAKIFTAAEVGPKEGYFNIAWTNTAKFIWGDDLKLDNIVYFRKKVSSATTTMIPSAMSLSLPNTVDGKLSRDNTCDGLATSPAISISNVSPKAKTLILLMDTIPGPARPGETQVGNHYYFFKYNLPISTTGFAEGAITPYAPPCSQGPGVKEYRVFLYSLDYELSPNVKYDGATLYEIGEKSSTAKAMKIITYSR